MKHQKKDSDVIIQKMKAKLTAASINKQQDFIKSGCAFVWVA